MGGVYDTQFGRMSGMLGLTNPNTLAAFLIPYNYSSPPTDLVRLSDDVSGAPIGSLVRRHADLEDLPQRRRHPPHPRPPVQRPADQPGRAGQHDRGSGAERVRLEGHLQGQPAGGHVPRDEAGHSDAGPAAVRGAGQRPPDRAGRCPKGPRFPIRPPRGGSTRRESGSRRSSTTSSTSDGSTCGTATSSPTKRWT